MTSSLHSQLGELRAAGDRKVSLAEIAEIVESVMQGLQGEVLGMDIRLFGEVEALNEAIKSARAELSAIGPEEIRDQHIPAATDELDAVVAATEAATNAIMEAAESIESIGASLDAGTQATLTDAVNRIYEACSFQDITGQRITKVVRTLKVIEAKVEGVLSAFGDEVARERKKDLDAALGEKRDHAAAQMLHGPALAGEGATQDDIDKLLASFD